MSFFVAPADETVLDLATEGMAKNPSFADRYDAIAELREQDRTGLKISAEDAAKANGFFRVASLQGPIETLAHVLNPDWLKVKGNFYRWLAKHPQHCTYDRRKDPRARQITMVDGKAVV